MLIEVQGPLSRLLLFSDALLDDAPPLSRIASMQESSIPLEREDGFVIGCSAAADEVETLIPPDIALCSDCRRELLDPGDRRFRYPFINCTNCGPRYTIVDRLPYDRPWTSMQGFTMCPECEREYSDPLNRRFHAQPNACSTCGPVLSLLDAYGDPLSVDPHPDPAALAASRLRDGAVVAIKSLGGFHLSVDALNDSAVKRLRDGKGREAKPFAVMMPSTATVLHYCDACEAELIALQSAEAPIVLLKKRAGSHLADSVAPGNDRLGVMLPYTPLHKLLFEQGPEVLVMTSANVSEEPIVSDNDEALHCLKGMADLFLMHNRPILTKCDDSVTIHLSGTLRQIRRSRGYVPAPISISNDGPVVFGTGGELKNTVALLKGSQALVSQHIGNVQNYGAYLHFEQTASHLQHLFQAVPELIVHDMHPSYMSTQWAMRQDVPILGVQHHHAHLASCLAENMEDGPAIGLLLDGTGYGTDGAVWGGEVLIGDAQGAVRFASLEPMPLPGGETAIKQPWRAGIGYLFRSCPVLPELPFMQGREVFQVLELLQKGVGSYETSSCGRLFDAVAAIAGLCGTISFEGEAAIALTEAAGGETGKKAFRFGLEEHHGRWLMLVSPIIQDVAAAVRQSCPSREISRRFHRTLIDCFKATIAEASRASAIRTVALSGGVWQNPLLFETLSLELEAAGYRVLTHSRLPANDGGISLGQAIIGRRYLAGHYEGVG
ncbi:Hydrogenase maturation protein HypF [Pelodictyon luteolum DSM 273]|uniref:Carbamoyltransferase n=1 Tax=Chlorobium luteolum (strain DSM 273 / BCRC 81028 / 2530) TaxID=319225 RepID=Q3B2W5_CHLL3|nr:Hydrogenase maturation protein HypF [Pelodictyon luteolum DSM 273]